MITIANGDITTQTAHKAMLTNAEARAAVAEVWNSLINEKPPADDPATLLSLFYRKGIRLD